MLKRMASVLTLVLASGATTFVTTTPAAAEDLRIVVEPQRIVVNQSYEFVPWRLAGSDTDWVDDVDVTLEHLATREYSGSDWSDSPPFNGQFKFYDWERFGKYHVYGEAWDYDYNEMSVASDYVWIKAASRSPLTINRQGSNVTLRTVTKRYSGGYPIWKNHRNATVRFQRLSSGSWRTIARRTVPRNGVTQFSYRRAAAATYRVVVGETSRVWGTTARTVRR